MTTVNEALVEQAYVLLFGRPADVGGLKFHAQLLDAGTSYAAIINGMTHAPEFASLFAGKNTEQILHQISDNSLKYSTFPSTVSGLDTLAAKIDHGQTTFGDVLAAPGLAKAPSDLANKVYEAIHFTHRVEELHLENAYSGDAANNIARGWISIIGSDFVSVAGAESILDQTIYRAAAAHG